MALAFVCIEASAYRLRYLATNETTDPNPVTGLIVNRTPPDIGMRKDSGGAFNNSPINQLVATPVANNVEARTLLFGDSLTTVHSIEIPRAHTRLTPKQPSSAFLYQWNIDAAEGAAAGDALSAGFAVLRVGAPGLGQAKCYIDVYYEHTFQR